MNLPFSFLQLHWLQSWHSCGLVDRAEEAETWPDSLPSPDCPGTSRKESAGTLWPMYPRIANPVSIIKGFSETLLQDFDTLKEGDQRNSSKRFSVIREVHSLVEDLLSLARLDSPESGFEKQHCDLKQLIERATDDFKSGMGEDSIAINLKIPEGNFSVHGDEDRLLSIFQNLLENASVHAQGLSKISISRRRKEILLSAKWKMMGREFQKKIYRGFLNGFTGWTKGDPVNAEALALA